MDLTPDAVGVGAHEAVVLRLRIDGVEGAQIADEDAFELRAVRAAFGLAGVVEDAQSIGEMRDGSCGDGPGLGLRGGVVIGLVQCCETTENDALIVGPGGLPVVFATGGKAVVDKMIAIDHAGVREPFPLARGPVEVGGALMRIAGGVG